ncbi:pentatricopeptide repeat-containing protein At1g08070, chloroplastic-like isoform X2 [Mercurialis annua]|uniref:pentatricopeptide repeat-containing protein At1g08070, chloroplastic-like isoform X2 n=1 Tax=Mercurialis annua TaxID=3986 RepID=UPI00215F179D|nr:pentatricopeptide repeat-containing protein At1g08070, chloroplastic-like isoform X2 [Mercurialis annua]
MHAKCSIEFPNQNDTPVSCFTAPPVIKACSSLLAVEAGQQVHSLVVSYGVDCNVYVQTSLMDFYAKIGELGSARKVFDGILVKDAISFNCLITGYSKAGDVATARKLFDSMTERTVVSWNAMISCYARNGDFIEGLKTFERMQAENFSPNEITLVTLLSICAKLGDLEMGLRIKKYIKDKNLCTDMIVSTAIFEMYVKCGVVDEARKEFDRMAKRDVVAWSAMIAGYTQNGRSNEALELFECMRRDNVKPDHITLVSVLSACEQLGSVEIGNRIGSYVQSQDLASNVYVASALLTMYSKCGSIDKARQVFDKIPQKDIVSWNSMIVGLAVNGLGKDAIALYTKMKEIDLKPNEITFVGLLTACTHAGLIELGLEFFESMKSDYRITPEIEHYACIVDLCCRYGRVKDAYEFICRMDIEPNVVIWGTLLGASRVHPNIELAELSARKLLELEPDNSGNYVQLSNIYASAGRWQEAQEVRNLMKDNKVQKVAAYSWIEMENQVHRFLVGDTSHPATDEVYGILDSLAMQSSWSGRKNLT